MPLVLREEKGSQLTFGELDGNFTYLEGLDQGKLTTSSFNTFTSSYTTGSFTGSFVGDGSGLTGIPGVTPIETGSFATTGSNTFRGAQTVSGSIIQTGIGSGNTAVGVNAGTSRTTGVNNTLLGDGAGFSATTSDRSVIIGYRAGFDTTTGDSNIIIGTEAGRSNSVGQMIAIGDSALKNVPSGSYNMAIGWDAGRYTSTFSNATNVSDSIFIGYLASPLGNGESNQIVIGNNAYGNGSNTTTIGNGSTSTTYLMGALKLSSLVNPHQVTGSFQVTGSANINGFTVLPQVSASLDFANDAAAAAGGVPLGGLYRNGNAIQIRLV